MSVVNEIKIGSFLVVAENSGYELYDQPTVEPTFVVWDKFYPNPPPPKHWVKIPSGSAITCIDIKSEENCFVYHYFLWDNKKYKFLSDVLETILEVGLLQLC